MPHFESANEWRKYFNLTLATTKPAGLAIFCTIVACSIVALGAYTANQTEHSGIGIPWMGALFITYFAVLDLFNWNRIKRGTNLAFRTNGVLIVRRYFWGDPIRLGAIFLTFISVIIWSDLLLFGIHSMVNQHGKFWYLYPVLAFVETMCAISLWRTGGKPTFRGLDFAVSPENLTIKAGDRTVEKIQWDEIERIVRSEKYPSIGIVSDTIKRRHRFDGSDLEHGTWYSLLSYSIEPNQLYRLINELHRNPELRALIATPEGQKWACSGPAWKEVASIPMGGTQKGVSIGN